MRDPKANLTAPELRFHNGGLIPILVLILMGCGVGLGLGMAWLCVSGRQVGS